MLDGVVSSVIRRMILKLYSIRYVKVIGRVTFLILHLGHSYMVAVGFPLKLARFLIYKNLCCGIFTTLFANLINIQELRLITEAT
jgi:hypothetical protein